MKYMVPMISIETPGVVASTAIAPIAAAPERNIIRELNGLKRASNTKTVFRSQKSVNAAMTQMLKADPYLRQIHVKTGPGRNTTIQCVGPVPQEGRSELKQLIAGLFGTNRHERQLIYERMKHVLSGGVISKGAERLLTESMDEGIITREQYDKMMTLRLSHQVQESACFPPLPSPLTAPTAPSASSAPPPSPPLTAPTAPSASSAPPPTCLPRSNLTETLVLLWSNEVQVVVDSKSFYRNSPRWWRRQRRS